MRACVHFASLPLCLSRSLSLCLSLSRSLFVSSSFSSNLRLFSRPNAALTCLPHFALLTSLCFHKTFLNEKQTENQRRRVSVFQRHGGSLSLSALATTFPRVPPPHPLAHRLVLSFDARLSLRVCGRVRVFVWAPQTANGTSSLVIAAPVAPAVGALA